MNVILSDLRQQKIKKIKNALTTKKLFIFGGEDRTYCYGLSETAWD